jgi:hypothetical protein
MKLFKDAKIRIAFKTGKTIKNLLHTTSTTDKYETTRVYKFTCLNCRKVCIGQTGCSLYIRNKEHIRNIK